MAALAWLADLAGCPVLDGWLVYLEWLAKMAGLAA
jgi:hypothetical protein